MRKRATLLLIVLLCGGCALPRSEPCPCADLPASCTVGQMALMPNWWAADDKQPKSASVQVNGSASIPVAIITPTTEQIAAGVPSAARGYCASVTTLRGGEKLVAVTERDGAKTFSTECKYETGDPYSFRKAGTPPVTVATITPTISPVGGPGVCTTTVARTEGGGGTDPTGGQPVPPPVDVPPGTPIPTKWTPFASEGSTFVIEGGGPAVARYGVEPKWTMKYVTTLTQCTAKNFGEIVDERPKGCEIETPTEARK